MGLAFVCGGVEKAKGKLEDGDELATNLEKVAAALGMLTEQQESSAGSGTAAAAPTRW